MAPPKVEEDGGVQGDGGAVPGVALALEAGRAKDVSRCRRTGVAAATGARPPVRRGGRIRPRTMRRAKGRKRAS